MSDDSKSKQQVELPKELTETLAKLGQGLNALADSHKAMAERIESLGTGRQQQQAPEEDEEEDDDLIDLEKLSRRELLNLIEKRHTKRLRSELEPIARSLTGVHESTAEKDIRAQIQDCVKKHPDFWEWRGEMQAIVKRNPNMTPEEAYVLARSYNPNKVKEVETKLETPEQKTERERKEQASKKTIPDFLFGGLTPTSGKTGGKAREKVKAGADPGEVAWERVIGGGELESTK